MWVRIVYNIVEYFDSATIAHPLTDTVLMKVLLFRTQFQFIRNLKNLHSDELKYLEDMNSHLENMHLSKIKELESKL